MYGSATLAMVVSSACISVARITQAVIARRLPPPVTVSKFTAPPLKKRGQEVGHPPRMSGIDIDLGAHSCTQRRHVPVAYVYTYAELDPLHDFDPVTAGVLCGQKRELLRGRWAQ